MPYFIDTIITHFAIKTLFGSASIRSVSFVTFVCVSAGLLGCLSRCSANLATFCFYKSTSRLEMTFTLSPGYLLLHWASDKSVTCLLSLYNGIICASYDGDFLTPEPRSPKDGAPFAPRTAQLEIPTSSSRWRIRSVSLASIFLEMVPRHLPPI